MKWGKVLIVILGALIVTALGIDAADTLSGRSGTLLGQLGATDSVGVCPIGMGEMSAPTSFTCFDHYEASLSDGCSQKVSRNALESGQLLAEEDCEAVSVQNAEPWGFVTREEAAMACTKVGKRLPTPAEWFEVARGTSDSEELCNVASGALWPSGSSGTCVSQAGAFDMVGNAWEWTTGDVFDGVFENRNLPQEGFVQQIDSGGIPTITSSTSVDTVFSNDYFWAQPVGVYAIMRGGFYASREDAGVYAVHAATNPNFSGAAVGFRCIK